MDNKPIDTKNIYVLFDYEAKMVYSIEGFKRDKFMGKLPANTRERNIFIEHFYKKGRRKVKFSEYKVFDPIFHGTAKYKKRYDTIELNRDQYLKFLQLMSEAEDECKDLSQALDLLFSRASLRYYEYKLNNEVVKLTKENMKIIFETINEQMKKL